MSVTTRAISAIRQHVSVLRGKEAASRWEHGSASPRLCSGRSTNHNSSRLRGSFESVISYVLSLVNTFE